MQAAHASATNAYAGLTTHRLGLGDRPMADADSRACTKCGAVKHISEFPLCRGKPRARCKPCHTADARRWAVENPERNKDRQREWRFRHTPPSLLGPPSPEWHIKARAEARREKWRAANPDAHAASQKKWADANKHISMETVRRRQAAKLRATPPWADKKAMQEVYRLARELSEAGVPHDVDHIVPLQHALVCGLHCPANLQVLPRRANRLKHNRWWPDMPE